MRRVHLYFTKLFGCLVVEGGMAIDTVPLADAIMRERPYAYLYLAFGQLVMPIKVASGSDIVTATADGRVTFATWIHNVGDLAVNVMYALPGEHRQGLKVAWNPRMGAQRIPFTRF